MLTLNDYPVFDGKRDFQKEDAELLTKQELTLYKKRKNIEEIGVEFCEGALVA